MKHFLTIYTIVWYATLCVTPSVFAQAPVPTAQGAQNAGQNAADDDERPDIYDTDETSRFHRVFRTSDDEAATPRHRKGQSYHQKPHDTAPLDAHRVGCICMDGSTQRQTASGACAGRKGVRFWVYERPNKDTLLAATERHKAHPEAIAPDAPIAFGHDNNTETPPLSSAERIFYLLLAFSSGGTMLVFGIKIWRQRKGEA